MDPVRLCISLGEAGSGSELALLASIILVTAGLGVVVATAVVVRHRSAAARHRGRVRARGAAPVTAGGYPVLGAVPTRRAPTGAGLEVAGDDLLACPTCLRRYAGEMRYCPHDARALVAAATLGGRRRGDGGACPLCRRGYQPGVRFCAHDGAELVRAEAREVDPVEPTGVIARACLQCRRRFDLAASFCAEDGSELVVIH